MTEHTPTRGVKWSLHRQKKDHIIDHEYSIWCNEELIFLVNLFPRATISQLALLIKAANRDHHFDALVKALEEIKDVAMFCRIVTRQDRLSEIKQIASEALRSVAGERSHD